MALTFFKEDTFLLQGLALSSCLTHASERRDAPAALQSHAVYARSACGRKGAVYASLSQVLSTAWLSQSQTSASLLSWTASRISNYLLPSVPSQIFYFPRLQPWEDRSLMHVCLFIYKWVISIWLWPLQLVLKPVLCVEESIFYLMVDIFTPCVS